MSSSKAIHDQKPLDDLGDDLVLRRATAEDREAVIEFTTRIFDERVRLWTSDLISGGHPTVSPGDFTLIEDLRTRRIVSSLCLVSQTWSYAGVPFRIGRCELVATDPEYRRRGLVRRQFEAIHALSAAKGELLQVIAGVEWFYRQFGYEMGVGLPGNRCIDAEFLDQLKENDGEACRLRAALPADHAFVRELYDRAMRTELFAAVREPAEWEYEFSGRSKANTRRREFLIIERTDGQPIGYIQYLPCLASPQWLFFRIYQVELVEGSSYLNLWPALLRALWKQAGALMAEGVLACERLDGLELAFEREHRVFEALPKTVGREIKPSPWYIRVPDVAAFLRHIRGALENHLIGTIAEGYTGELNLSFYRSGVRLAFSNGKITGVENWSPNDEARGDARFPPLTFLQLAMGWRRLRQLMDAFPDCAANYPAEVLLNHLFPPFHGKLWLVA